MARLKFLEAGTAKDGNPVLNEKSLELLSAHSSMLFSYIRANSKDCDLQKNIQFELHGRNKANNSNIELRAIHRKIKDEKSIGNMQFSAFVSAVDSNNRFDIAALKQVQGVILFLAYQLNLQDGYKDAVTLGLRQIRLMIDNSDYRLFEALPSFSNPLPIIVEKLREAENQNDDRKLSRRLEAIRLLIQHYLEKSPRIKVSRGASDPSEITYRGEILSVAPVLKSEPDSHTYAEYKFVVIESGDNSCARVERLADQTPVDHFAAVDLVAPRSVKKSLALQHLQAKNEANQIAKRNKQLSCDVSNLTRYEIRVFLKEMDARLNSKGSFVDLCALLVLFTGKDIKSLAGMKDKPNSKSLLSWKVLESGRVQIMKNILLPSHELATRLQSLKVPSNSTIVMTLPAYVSDFFLDFFVRAPLSIDVEAEINGRLAEINKRYNCRITITRLMNYLGYFLKHQGVDSAEIALLKMDEKILHPGNYYYQVSSDRLSEIYQNYSMSLLSYLNSDKKNKPLAGVETFLGSHLQVDKRYVRLLFSTVKAELERVRYQASQIEKFHNLYVVYTLQLLFLATGHRPVRNPFESKGIFDFNSKTIFISDKESRSQLAARVLVLPDVAIRQMKFFNAHIEEMKSHYSFLSKALSDQIAESQNGKTPQFFFIVDARIEYVIPKNLVRHLKDIFPIPLNWHRHLLRSYLGNKNLPGDWIDSWMGHADFGGGGFERFSALSLKNLAKVAEDINSFIEVELSVSALAGRRCP